MTGRCVERVLKIGDSVEAGFEIERVKDCLGKKKIDSALNERWSARSRLCKVRHNWWHGILDG